MMRSLFSGVSGLKTHQTRMDVIGNNIANVNTVAFKASTMTFNALMSQTTQNASGPNAATGTGGVNARQIGLGVKGGAINVNIAGQGSAQSTGNPFDIMITGSNFFVVNDGVSNYFTRDGSFYVDAAGNLAMTSTGYNVMGWQVDPDTGKIKKDTVSALRIMNTANMTYPPDATTQAYVSGIIDKNDTDVTSASGKVMNLNFFDALGYSYTAKLVMRQSDIKNEYSVELDKLLDSTGKEIPLVDANGNAINPFGTSMTVDAKRTITLSKGYTLTGSTLTDATDPTIQPSPTLDLNTIFDNNGNIKDDAPEESVNLLAKAFGYEGSENAFYNLTKNVTTGTPPNETTTTMSIGAYLMNAARGDLDGSDTNNNSFEVDGRTFTGGIITYDPDNGKFKGINGTTTQTGIGLDLTALGGNFSRITVDFATSSMYDNKGTSTITAKNGDVEGLGTGRRLGKMTQISVQQNGMIYAAYDNGMTRLLGQIASASFENPSGLEKEGDNLYSATMNSGEFDGIGVDITADGGYMSTGQLEMSNVDLSSEFTEMITTQRGFQANSRIITVSDTLLEELTNLKR
mgnify:FL=1